MPFSTLLQYCTRCSDEEGAPGQLLSVNDPAESQILTSDLFLTAAFGKVPFPSLHCCHNQHLSKEFDMSVQLKKKTEKNEEKRFKKTFLIKFFQKVEEKKVLKSWKDYNMHLFLWWKSCAIIKFHRTLGRCGNFSCWTPPGKEWEREAAADCVHLWNQPRSWEVDLVWSRFVKALTIWHFQWPKLSHSWGVEIWR